MNVKNPNFWRFVSGETCLMLVQLAGKFDKTTQGAGFFFFLKMLPIRHINIYKEDDTSRINDDLIDVHIWYVVVISVDEIITSTKYWMVIF